MAANRASLRFGKSQSSMGRRISDVLDAENSAVDANEMKSNQKTSGPYRQNRRRVEWGSIIRLKSTKGSRACCFPLPEHFAKYANYCAAAPETTSIISFVMAA